MSTILPAANVIRIFFIVTYNLESGALCCKLPIVARVHLVDEIEPDDGRGKGFQGIGLYQLLPDKTGEEHIAGAERGEDEGVDDEDCEEEEEE